MSNKVVKERNLEYIFYLSILFFIGLTFLLDDLKIVLWIIPIIGIKILRNLKFDLFGIMLIFMPFMFYIRFPFTINTSMADFIIIFLFFKYSKLGIVSKSKSLLIKYSVTLIVVMLLSLINLYKWEDFMLLQGLVSIAKIAICFMYAVTTLNYLKLNGKERFLKASFYSGMIFMGLMMLGVILYGVGIQTSLIFAGTFRATGTYEDPNLAAAHVFLWFSFMSAYCIYNKKYILEVFVGVATIVCVFLTSSKGALVALYVAMIIVLFLAIISCNLKGIFKIAIILSCTVAIGYIGYEQSNVIKGIFDSIFLRLDEFIGAGTSDHSFTHRKLLWDLAFELGIDNPILGVGVEQYRPAASALAQQNIWNIVHNTYLTFWAELGFIGLVAFLWLPVKIYLTNIALVFKKSNFLIYIFSMSAIVVSMWSISLSNFRVLWCFLAFLLYEGYDKE